MSSDVCVVGNLNADLILYPLKDLPAWGSELITTNMSWRPGGIANALLCLARLGVQVSAIANVGDDVVGKNVLSRLDEAGIDSTHIERSAHLPTAVSVALGREDGERAFVTNLGHLEQLTVELVLKHRQAWDEAACVLVSGYFLLPGVAYAGTRRLIDALRAEGKLVLLDTGWDIENWPARSVREVMQLLEGVDLFLPSLNEARALTSQTDPHACLDVLCVRSRRGVIIKMGGAGCIARTEEGTFEQPAFPVKALDTTGAGDCFNSGIILGLLNDWGMARTLRFANALAAMVISRPREEGYPTLGQVQEFLHQQRSRVANE